MKNRKVPFGYRYANGIVELHPDESAVLKKMCQDYLTGKSLLAISQWLNQQQIEYLPGVTGWNKARLKRIFEDIRYIGDDTYPGILEKNDFMAMQEVKSARCTQSAVDRSSAIHRLKVPITCPKCGSKMHRRNDSRCACKNRWVCDHDVCKTVIEKLDEDMIAEIIELLNYVIENPDMVSASDVIIMEPSLESRRLSNEIGRMFDGVDINRDNLRSLLLRSASQKYRDIQSGCFISRMLKREFENAEHLEDLSLELFGKTVKAISFDGYSQTCMVLLNEQIIKKEVPHA